MRLWNKLRYTHLKNQRYSPYFKYAIGEVVLIVLGVLIALNVNNWNEKKKLHTQNQIYLKKLKSDLEVNLDRLDKLIIHGFEGTGSDTPGLQEAVSSSDSLVKILYRGLTPDDIPFLTNARFDYQGSYYDLKQLVVEELINTGKLYTLGSDRLIDAVKQYKKICDREHEYVVSRVNYMHEVAKMYFFNSIYQLAAELTHNPEFTLDDAPWLFEYDSQKYKNFKFGMFLYNEIQGFTLVKAMLLKKETQKLINIIEEEQKQSH